MATSAGTTTTPKLGSYVTRWAVPVLWGLLPAVAGPAFADALDPRSRPVQIVASVGLWLIWAVTLGASLVPRTTTLTLIRIVIPVSVVATGWAAWAGPSVSVSAAAGIGLAAAVTIVALSSFTGDLFVNGSAYGDERRMPLRPPAALLLGPMQVAWVACAVGAPAGPLLLASEQWVIGAVALLAGWPAAWFSARALHGLAQRWVVFVPAGFVLHDLMALTDPLLLPRRMVKRLGPAPADTTATDFTLGSLGLALEVDLAEPTGVTPVPRRTRPGQRPSLSSLEVDAMLFSPSRPGAVLREAAARRFAIG